MTPWLYRLAAAFAPLRGRGDLVENAAPAKPAEPEHAAVPFALPSARPKPRVCRGEAHACASLAA